jgi:hypothetical protein
MPLKPCVRSVFCRQGSGRSVTTISRPKNPSFREGAGDAPMLREGMRWGDYCVGRPGRHGRCLRSESRRDGSAAGPQGLPAGGLQARGPCPIPARGAAGRVHQPSAHRVRVRGRRNRRRAGHRDGTGSGGHAQRTGKTCFSAAMASRPPPGEAAPTYSSPSARARMWKRSV